MIYKKSDTFYIVGLFDGEDIIDSLQHFLSEERIRSGFFWGIGGVRNPSIGVYDVLETKFKRTIVKGIYEIVSFHGNVSVDPDSISPFIHAHISLAKKDFSIIGGHFFDAEVAVSLEMIFMPTQNPIVREINPLYKVMLWEHL
ncbi:MAG: DNA-binding protein [Aquificae bacterium]|nr:DNA-binding protein [Aquificota bacterium]